MTELQTENKVEKPKRKPRQKKQSELDDLKLWLTGLGQVAVPNLHVNGRDYSMAVVTVDFGTPLEEQKITPEQTAELVNKLKLVTKSLYKTEVNVRVQNDSNNGIWWTSIN